MSTPQISRAVDALYAMDDEGHEDVMMPTRREELGRVHRELMNESSKGIARRCSIGTMKLVPEFMRLYMDDG